MSEHGSVGLEFGDGHYTFRLALGQWRELQDKTNAGPLELYERILTRRWRLDDLRETIRIGLIGGGTNPSAALKLVANYVDARPLLESAPIALQIIAASLVAPEEDRAPAGEAVAAGQDASASPPTTETVQ